MLYVFYSLKRHFKLLLRSLYVETCGTNWMLGTLKVQTFQNVTQSSSSFRRGVELVGFLRDFWESSRDFFYF